MKEFNLEELRLGGDILENALHGCYSEESLAKYQRILSMPGIDGALYLLYKAIQHDVSGNAKVFRGLYGNSSNKYPRPSYRACW